MNLKPYCPVDIPLKIIGGKWKLLILWHLGIATKRFNEIKKAIPEITEKMLTKQLREMERDGVVHRKVYAEVPPRVEYKVTELGKNLEPVIDALCCWGKEYETYLGRDNQVTGR